MVAQLFHEQREFVLDDCLRKSALCPRRSGKSFSCLTLMSRTALYVPGAQIKYICLTRGQAKKNLWAELRKWNKTFELDLKFHETNLTATFPNGSVIEFAGAETRSECEKFRGQYFHLVVIDEAKSFQADILYELIEEILAPALTDYFGTLAMIGTPGNVLAGPFFEATSDYDPTAANHGRKQYPRPYKQRDKYKANKWKWDWSFHSWHTKHNTAKPHIWEAAIAAKLRKGIPDTDPAWLREWMGQWCPSDSLMVYAFSRELNTYSGGPLPDGHDWQYLLGLDLGYNDSTAIVVAAFSDTHPEMYQVYEYKEPELTVDQIESQVNRVLKKFPKVGAMIADTGGLGKTIVESLRERGLGFEAANKTDKLDHIELVNTDLRGGKIKLLPDSRLAAEMNLLQWTDKTYKKENKSTDNHCCDAFLYLIRHAYHHFWEKPSVEPEVNTREWEEAYDERELEAMLASERTRDSDLDPVETTYLDGGELLKWN